MSMFLPTFLDLFILTVRSGNRKVGKGTPVSMSHMGTCPPSCGLREGCYATCGKLGLVWRKLTQGRLANGVPYSDFIRQVKALDRDTTIWRHNQSGDLSGRNGRLHRGRCTALAAANAAQGYNRGGYTFTHYSPIPIPGSVSSKIAQHNADVIASMNSNGFCVNLSADNPVQADIFYSLGIGPVVTLLPRSASGRLVTPAGRRIVICPATRHEKTTCVSCKACARSDRKVIIGFPAHGASVKKVDKVARNY